MDSDQLAMLPLWYAVFLLSLTCHEAAHAFAAQQGGDPTAYHEGQVTLNPLPHMRREPLGMLIVPLISFLQLGSMMGWASAPYDPVWEERHPRRAAAMAVAGPVANLILAVAGFAVLKAGLIAGLWELPAGSIHLDALVETDAGETSLFSGLGRFCSVLLSLNLLLFLFNLLPWPPLDGSSVLAGLFPPARRMRGWLRSTPIAALAGLVAAWYVFGRLYGPVLSLVLGWLYR